MNFLCPFREDMLVDELGHAPPHKACESVLAATSLWINSIPSFLPGRGAKSLPGFGSSGVSFDVWGASQLWFCPSNKFINSAADFYFELKKVTSRFGFAPESLPVTLWQTIKRHVPTNRHSDRHYVFRVEAVRSHTRLSLVRNRNNRWPLTNS